MVEELLPNERWEDKIKASLVRIPIYFLSFYHLSVHGGLKNREIMKGISLERVGEI